MAPDPIKIKELFPALTHPDLLAQIAKFAVIQSFNPGEMILGQGDKVAVIPLLMSGRIKVIKEDGSGREILVYYIEPGESCVLSLSSLLSFSKSKITAISEGKTEVLILPGNLTMQWMREYNEWMQFVFGLFDRRLSDVMTLIEAIAFQKADERLWKHLQKKAALSPQKEIFATHQDLALELGTVREVISRLLKGLEKSGKVILSRGKIVVLAR